MVARFFLDYFLPLSSIPAVIVSLAGLWVLLTQRVGDSPRRWTQFLLVAAILLTIPLTLFADRVLTGQILYILLLLIPALNGVLAMILLNSRDLYAGWQERRSLLTALLLTLILLLILTALVDLNVAIVLILPAIATAGFWAASQRIGMDGLAWLSAALAILLLLDAAGLAASPAVYTVSWYRVVYAIAGPLVLFFSLIAAALLIDRGLAARRAGYQKRFRLYFILALGLFLALAATTYRSGLMVKASGHAAEDHMPFLPAAVGVIVGLLLAFALQRRHLWAGLAFVILVPITFSGAYAAGWQVDPIVVTANRAARIEQAVDRYHQETGGYPASLAELTPGYLPILLGPLNGRGQGWCYQAGENFYRLGYAYYQRYHYLTYQDPFSEIRVYSTAGEPPLGGWMCDQELKLIQATSGL